MGEVNDIVAEGDPVILLDKRGKKWLVTAGSGKSGLDIGNIDLKELVGKRWGDRIDTHLGEPVWVLKPTLEDFIMKYQRPTQIVYPKDLGFIFIRSGIKCGSVVVEAGTGSGALTTLLAWAVHPEGHVYSYEIREDLIEVAKRNLERAGMLRYVTIKNKDISSGIDERDVDAIFLDLGDPWKAVDPAYDALKGGGSLVVITPTYNQAEKVIEKMKGNFVDIETVEIFLRRILVRPGKTRPDTRMVAFTALITTGRKILR